MERVREGTLFKTIELCGTKFEIRYGYYADFERENEQNEPIPIYPNFVDTPQYTNDGYPFVTHIQDMCDYGHTDQEDRYCVYCPHFMHGDEMIGICRCEHRRLNSL